jgi:xeroderma pigmentosum group C-complementing protein
MSLRCLRYHLLLAPNEKRNLKVKQAFWEAEQDASEKARTKIQERAIQQWVKLIQGLRIRQRLKEQYKRPDSPVRDGIDNSLAQGTLELVCLFNSIPPPASPAQAARIQDTTEHMERGRFLIGADDAIQPFKLPKNKYHTTSFQNNLTASSHSMGGEESTYSEIQTGDEIHDVSNDDMEVLISELPDSSGVVPMSMLELAALQEEEKHELPISSASESTTKVLPSAHQGRVNPRRAGKKRARGTARTSSDSSDHELSSPPKKERAHTEASVTKRNLRPRLAKSPEKRQEEKEMERAYRRAMEE